ncbi:MAG: OmpA family protein [Deltaproteobacteria bacterium]|nr:OmpA family protein [Deltaproteobacteria bacterium]
MTTKILAILGVAATLFGSGCGYSEEEMRARLRDIEGLRQQLAAEGANNKKFQRELDEARTQIEQLKSQLSDANVDVANLKSDVEEKAKALEEYKRRAAQLEEIRRRFDLLRSKLQDLTRLGLKVTLRHNRMVIELPGDVLFDSGRETLKKQGEEILLKIADVVRRDPALMERDFQVAGHTDSQAYGVGPFKDNWGLSVMRAREVLSFLVRPEDKKGGGLKPERWSASGYGDTDPIAANDSPEGRQSNRRCELVVLPKLEEMLDLKSITGE